MKPIGPAHAVVIDCALFLATQVMADDRTDLVWSQLARAVPDAGESGNLEIDRLVSAAAAYLAARDPAGSTAHADAHWSLRSAVDRYAWARLTRSASALLSTNERPAK